MDIFNLSFDLKFCRISYHEKDWHEAKTKGCYTFWNLLSGELEIEINGKIFRAYEGDVILFHPGDTYRAWCSGEHSYFLVTFFDIRIGSNINLLKMSDNSGIYHGEEIKVLSDRFCIDYKDKFSNLSTPNLLQYSSFLEFFAGLEPYFGRQESFLSQNEAGRDSRLTELIKYIDENIESGLTVKQLSQHMNMSEKYFSNYFKLRIGDSPKQYLVKCQMKYALTLLTDSNLSLQEISQQLGFCDQYSFSKAFKNYYGESPIRFRKHYLATN